MALDIRDGYGFIKKKVSTTQTYAQVSSDIEDLKKRSGDSLELANKTLSEQLSSLKTKTDNFQKGTENVKSQFEELLDLSKLISSDSTTKGNSKTTRYLKKIFVKSLQELTSQLPNLINELGVKAIGCSEDQTYLPNQSIYIKVKSIDFMGLLKDDPQSVVGKITYEKNDIQYNIFPFSMNRELYGRTQDINQPYSVPSGSDYLGVSTQNLFDITYVESYVDPVTLQTITGNFFKVDLKPRQNNLVTEFLKDYYETIEVLDYKNVFSHLMDQLTGAISIEKGYGDADLLDINKVLLIFKRLIGLCFDSNKEIDVSGVAKVSENDNIDESFFEFNEIDLRTLDQKISDIKLGVVEFEECQSVKLSVDSLSIVNSINNLNFIDGGNNNNQINDASNLTDVATNGFFPISVNIDFSFLKEFPKSIAMAVLSPKTVLPIMVLSKSIGNNVADEINSFVDFVKKLKTYVSELITKITEVFVKILFDIIKKDIKALISRIINNVAKEKTKKYTDMVLSLTALLVQIANIIKDFRECKSIINQLQSLLNNIQTRTSSLPLPLLLASKLRKGYSKTGAFLRVIKEFEELGLPTGPMPDGSPNLMLAAAKAIINGIDDEMTENGRVDIAIPPLSITPVFITVPNVGSGVVM
jgi:hypothetical protein